MNVDSWLKKARTRISALDAELLLLFVLQERDRIFLMTHLEMRLADADVLLLDKLIEMREQGMPLAYISGEKEFYGRVFQVNQHVLIPRPDSETIIDIAKRLDPRIFLGKVLDVGTGSGVLAITLSLEMPMARVSASDIERDALFVASKNAISLGARVDFLESNLLKRFPKDEKFDLIVANLPYVDIGWPWRSKELEWEPGSALYAGDGGTEIIKKFMTEAVGRTRYVILECDPCQHKTMIKFSKNLGFVHIETRGFQLVFSYKV
ncbi:peptide chain release factor N(5)-glutamine methyltransferase [Candidatus Saccharibacteria bacterium]|nr:peptide chain release factor N(5)-glutamine methyltransferase [Candidatus Saccharibacteria bacterium]